MVVRRLPASDELTHHGILGQKWGVRRFQNADGSLTNAGKKRKGLVQTIKDKKKAKMLREAKARKKAEQEKKEAIIRSGDEKEIRKIKGQLTDEELARALDRVNMTQSLNSYAPGGSNYDKTQKAISTIEKIAKAAQAVGTIAKAVNDVGGAVKTINGLKADKEKNSKYMNILNEHKSIAETEKSIKENEYYLRQMRKGNYSHLNKEKEKKNS